MTMLVRAIFLEGSPDTEQFAMLLRSGAPAVPTKKRALWWLRKPKGPNDRPPSNTPPKS
jgi:hypothetical protein